LTSLRSVKKHCRPPKNSRGRQVFFEGDTMSLESLRQSRYWSYKSQLYDLPAWNPHPRPRPLMFIGYVNGKRCYVRKRGLSYIEMCKKYPAPKRYHIGFVNPYTGVVRHHYMRFSLFYIFCKLIDRLFGTDFGVRDTQG